MLPLYYTVCIADRDEIQKRRPAGRPLEVRNLNAEFFPHPLPAAAGAGGVSQRTAAGALGISQALLSHYENGIREPAWPFVVRGL